MRCLLIAALLLCGCSSSEESSKNDFKDFLNYIVDDPKGLEIIEWGTLDKPDGIRWVHFRCNQIRGDIKVERAQCKYKNSKIVSAVFTRCQKVYSKDFIQGTQ